MDKIREVCPICDCDKYEKVFFRDFTPMKEITPFRSYDVVVCEKCGFVYANNIIENRSLFEYYQFISKYDMDFGEDEENKNRYRSIADFLSYYLKPQTSILDVGCSNGGLLSMLKKEYKFRYLLGLEPSAACSKFAKEKYEIDVIVGTIYDDIKIKNEKFDLIILEQVMEHIIDLKKEISEYKKHLNINGKIYIGIPDLARLNEYKQELFQAFSSEHVNYFNFESLRSLMENSGFSLIGYEKGIDISLISLWEFTGEYSDKYYSNDKTKECLLEYINTSQKLLLKVKSKIEYLECFEGIYIWGAGTHTATLLQLTNLKKCNIKGIIDTNKNYIGKKVMNIPIVSYIEKIEISYPILISSQYAQDTIEDFIKTLKLGNKIIKLY